MTMTDNDILEIANDIDSFLIQQAEMHDISAIDLSAIVSSRLRAMNAAEDSENDYDSLLDHLNSQSVVIPKTIH
jgi:hypothetical protein